MTHRRTEQKKWKRRIFSLTALAAALSSLWLTGCIRQTAGQETQAPLHKQDDDSTNTAVRAVDFDRTLDEYKPLKNTYNFYFTYKTIHPWWDAVALGIEDAARQYEEMGIIIEYEYLAPKDVSPEDQTRRLLDASARNFDVIGVDVADVDIMTPVINKLMEDGHKIMTFSSSDADREDGCRRIAYVGNTHNYEAAPHLQNLSAKSLGTAER